MKIGGISIVLVAGLCLFVLIVFQVLTGRGIIRKRMKAHRVAGYIMLGLAMAHGLLAILTR